MADKEKTFAYLKDKPEFAEDLKEELNHFEEQKADLADYISRGTIGNYYNRYGITGKVIELYDSTGKATWKSKGIFPFIRPRKGDRIHLAY